MADIVREKTNDADKVYPPGRLDTNSSAITDTGLQTMVSGRSEKNFGSQANNGGQNEDNR